MSATTINDYWMRPATIISAPGIMAGGAGQARPAVARMQIIWALIRTGVFPNATQMARYLETSTKSVHRDIEFMRDRLRFDIRYDGSRFGYFTPLGPVRCPFCDLNMCLEARGVAQLGPLLEAELNEHKRRVPALLTEDQ